jgi:hypothetical protein
MNRSLNLFGTQDSWYSTSVKISLHFLGSSRFVKHQVPNTKALALSYLDSIGREVATTAL